MLFLHHKDFFGSLPIAVKSYKFDSLNGDIPSFAVELPEIDGALKAFHEHNHDDPELILVTSGHLYTNVDGKEYCFSAGDILCISPYEIHKGYVLIDECTEYICLNFSLSLIPNKTAQLGELISNIKYGRKRFHRKIECASKVAGYIGRHIQKLYDLKYKSQSQNELEMLGTIILIMSALVERVGLVSVENASRDIDFILKVTDYIESNYMKPISTEDAVAYFEYGYSHFCALFKKNFDERFVEFLNRYRINKSVMLMNTTDYKMSSIAKSVGFSDYKYFNQCFKRYMRVSPTEYRGK